MLSIVTCNCYKWTNVYKVIRTEPLLPSVYAEHVPKPMRYAITPLKRTLGLRSLVTTPDIFLSTLTSPFYDLHQIVGPHPSERIDGIALRIIQMHDRLIFHGQTPLLRHKLHPR